MDKYYKTTDAPQCGNHRLPDLKSQNELLAKRFCEELGRANALEVEQKEHKDFVLAIHQDLQQMKNQCQLAAERDHYELSREAFAKVQSSLEILLSKYQSVWG